MASKPRSKAGGGAKGKASRRAPARVKRGSGVPLMPVVVGGILGLLAIGMIAWIVYSSRPTPGPSTVAGIPCDSLEHTQVHYHAGLQIIYNGNVVNIPDNVGIRTDSAGNSTCLYWLHVHAANKNVIHIESPANQVFTLGQFFDVWNAWSKASGKDPQLLDATHVSSFTLTPDQKMVTYIDLQDGKGPQVYTGDPRAIVLRSHEVISIEISPPSVTPPSFTFESGL